MGDFSTTPEDFSQWVPRLHKRVNDACKSNALQGVWRRFGGTVFSELQNTKASDKLRDWLLERSNLNSYLSKRWYIIFLIVLAIIFLVICCLAASAVDKRVQRKAHSLTNGRIPPPPRKVKYKDIWASERYRLWGVASILGIIAICAAAMDIVFTSQILSARDAIECNTWQLFNGHYNGVHDIDRGNYNNVSIRWSGTVNMQKELKELEEMTIPGDENTIAYNIITNWKKVTPDLIALNASMFKTLSDAWETVNIYSSEVEALNKLMKDRIQAGNNESDPSGWSWNGPKYSYKFQIALKPIFQKKAFTLVTELNDTISKGSQIIPTLVSKHTNSTSVLMNVAHAAVINAQNTIREIDTAFASMVDIWDTKGYRLISLITGGVALGFIGAILTFLSVSVTIFISVKLAINLRQKKSATTSDVVIWKVAFVMLCVAIGVCCFTASLMFFTAIIGRDACDIIDDDILDKGMWDVLGDNLLHPMKDQENVYMTTVFDTCVKRGGTGTIGESLGVQQSINDVDHLVDKAVREIEDAKTDLLKVDSREIRVSTMGYILKELLRAIDHNSIVDEMGYSAFGAANRGRPSFNELINFSFEKHDSSLDGKRVMLSLLPAWNDGTLSAIASNGLISTVATTCDGYKWLNQMAEAYYTTNNHTSKFPKAFCGTLAIENEAPCSKLPNYVDLYKATSKDVDNWLSDLDVVLPVYGDYMTAIANRTRLLIESIRYVEQYGRSLGQTPYFLEYKNCTPHPDRKSCTFDQIRSNDVEVLETRGQKLLDDYHKLINLIDSFIKDKAVQTIRDVVKKAKKIVDDSNCQAEGTIIDNAIYDPLCKSSFPGIIASAIAMLVITVVLYFLALQTWIWAHYVAYKVEEGKEEQDEIELLNTVYATQE